MAANRRRRNGPRGDAEWSANQLRAAGVLLPKKSKDITSQVDCPSECARAFALRDQVLDALVRGDLLRLFPLLKSLGKVRVTKQILAVTGIGHLAADASLWRRSPHPRAVIFARVLKQKWLLDVRGSETLDLISADLRGELKGFKNESFLCTVNIWADILEEIDSQPLSLRLRQRLGLLLTLCGFDHISHLGGLTFEELSIITESPVLKAALQRLLARAALQQPRSLGSCPPMLASPTVKSAAEFVDTISPRVVTELEQHVSVELENMGIRNFDTESKPMNVIKKMRVAREQGHNPLSVVQERVRLLKMESARTSLASISSALKAWHAFAVHIRGLQECATLPPQSEEQACEFLALFRSGKTASNYISYVKWTCVHLNLDVSWYGEAVRQTLAGVNKRAMRYNGGPARVAQLLTTPILEK